jgi:predicted GTPase
MSTLTAIRTQIDNALVSSIASITDFIHAGSPSASIFLNPSRTIQESEPKPYVLILTDAEKSSKNGLYRRAKYMVEISVWGEADDNDTLYPLLVDYMAKINLAVIPIESILRQAKLILEIEETGVAMDTYFYETGKGVGVSQYEITYQTAYGNPFQLNPV